MKGVVRHWSGLLQGVVASPALEVFQGHVDIKLGGMVEVVHLVVLHDG